MKLHRPAACTTLAAALLLAGCASLAPPHERPAAPVARQFPLTPAGETGAPATERPWREFFGTDERLRRLIELALANNRDLRVAVLNIEAARAQAGVVRADRWPTVNAAVTGNRQPSASGDGTSSVYSAGLAVTAFELDLFGRVRSATDAALARLSASEAARQAAHIALVAAVASQHVALAADDALIALTRRTLESRQESLRLFELRFQYGTASEVDLRTGQTAVETARTALLQQERQRALDQNALELLVGQPLPADLPPASFDPQTLADVPAGLPADVLLGRPDVRQAEEQLRAAEADIGIARAAFFPRITLTGSVGVASTELSGLFNAGRTAWTFMPQLLAPLFDAGRNRANLQLTQAQRDIAVAQYEGAVQSAFRDVADVLAGRATLGEQVRSARALADAEEARFRLIELRLRNGVAGTLELLDAQRSLFTAQQQLVQAQAQLLQNRIAAYRALGGGWSA
jgi:multidrug efflux system outer membrane protein